MKNSNIARYLAYLIQGFSMYVGFAVIYNVASQYPDIHTIANWMTLWRGLLTAVSTVTVASVVRLFTTEYTWKVQSVMTAGIGFGYVILASLVAFTPWFMIVEATFFRAVVAAFAGIVAIRSIESQIEDRL